MFPILVIDNYDSYTYNLYQLIYSVNQGVAPVVLKNDDKTLESLVQSGRLAEYFGAVVISPGPGSPEHEQVSVARSSTVSIGLCSVVSLMNARILA